MTIDANNKKLLLVEDEYDIREYLEEVLVSMGFEVTSCIHGEMAFEEYKDLEGHYDVILSDMKMPVMDGLTLLKKIRSYPTQKPPKFIAMTGGIDIDFEDKNNEISGLVDGYILKPFGEAALKKALGLVTQKITKAS